MPLKWNPLAFLSKTESDRASVPADLRWALLVEQLQNIRKQQRLFGALGSALKFVDSRLLTRLSLEDGKRVSTSRWNKLFGDSSDE